MTEQLLKDYSCFHELALLTHDVDPVYPVLTKLCDMQGLDVEERIRAVFTHVAYYDLGSALTAMDKGWDYTLPCGTERRNHRVPSRLEKHVWSLRKKVAEHGSFLGWIGTGIVPGVPQESWANVTELLLSVWGNGRWAAYKTCEMLNEVAGVPLEAPDMGHAHSTGPRQGLALLYPPTATYAGHGAQAVQVLDSYSKRLCSWLGERGLPARVANVETTLCDFHSMYKGRYYVGHDIDQMQEQLNRMETGSMKFAAFTARRESLPRDYLGEANGRDGVDKVRRSVYKKTGVIATRGDA